jgi:hypothetical protein
MVETYVQALARRGRPGLIGAILSFLSLDAITEARCASPGLDASSLPPGVRDGQPRRCDRRRGDRPAHPRAPGRGDLPDAQGRNWARILLAVLGG